MKKSDFREDGRERKKINKLFTSKGSVRIAKNCDIGLEKEFHASITVFLIYQQRVSPYSKKL